MINHGYWKFKGRSYRASLFVCLPTHGTSFIYLHIGPAHAGKQKIDAISDPFASMPAIGRWTDFRDSALPVLTDELIFRIIHFPRWQTSRFLKFCIVVVDRCPDYKNTALLDFYKIEQSRKSALLIFGRMKISEKLHYQFPWFFTQYELNQRIYITSRQCWFSETGSFM